MLKSLSSFMYIGQNQRKGIVLTCLFILSYGIFRHYYVQFYFKPLPEIVITKAGQYTLQDHSDIQTFDLNVSSADQLTSIGISEKLAARIINFRDKIGGFKNWDKVQKVYGLTPSDLELIKKYSSIDQGKSENNSSQQKYQTRQSISGKNYTEAKRSLLKPINFDPNTVTPEVLKSMGLSPKIINGIINFRKAGFKYKSSNDLKRIYSMDEKTFASIEPFIQIQQTIKEPFTKTVSYPSVVKKISTVDINAATAEQLDQLPGIGMGYANKILNWRNKLGGFHSLDQFKSTYNLPDSVFQKIKPYITFKTDPVRININQCDEAALAKHFYIGFKEAKIIIAYRSNHGPYRSKEDLIKVGAVDQSWVDKVSPYLNFK